MDALQLENQWKKLIDKKGNGFITMKIDAKCKPDLDLGINSKKRRCLLLRLPKSTKTNFRGETKENLKTSFYVKENCIVLELIDEYYYTLFNDLIISLFFKIKDLENHLEYKAIFISTINKWSAFLANSRNNKLSEDVIKGMFGELSVLNELLINTTPQKVNSILKSWQGPYDVNTDFVFDNKNIEVKTKSIDNSKVKISSEHQLDNEPGKSMELLVVSVESNYNSKETIESLTSTVKDSILKLNGDLSILFEALAQKSLFPSNLKEYNNYKFTLKQHITYDCNLVLDKNKVFPRLIKSKLPIHISKVKYSVNLQDLEGFITTIKSF
ncbi:PD-(D/E)XK motif protein [Winogradskyella damuponensis]|uniref:PD-(D/E)XK motif protein n=1 Tax=Winogradskyella damuponensis TaxID=943939 RepID=A0ABP8CP24_9FLAO